MQGETGKKQQELLLSVTLGLFTKCKGISCSGKKLRFTSILTSYCLRTAVFSLLGFFTYGSEEPLLENPCFPSTEDTSGKISPGLFGTFCTAAWKNDKCSEKPGNVTVQIKALSL